MTFLELCVQLAHEAGVDEEVPMITVAGQTGELRRIVDWTSSAWLDILNLHTHWNFLWENPDLTIPSGTNLIVTNVGVPAPRYDTDSAYFDDGSPSRKLLEYLPWQTFRATYRQLSSDNNVSVWTVRPDNKIAVNALVTADKLCSFERWAVPVAPDDDADTPPFDADLHEVIVWRALVKYANFDEARVQRETAIDEMNTRLTAMRSRHLPRLELGGALGDE